ncbi:MAG: MBOAT family protein [Butyrivibrio sp.]|nr:MBOAT family protein [Butyrivibrio sp.]
MQFTLFTFIYIFAVACAFYLLPGIFRKYILLLASIAYILKYNVRSCIWMVLTSVTVYLIGIALEKLIQSNRKSIAKGLLIFVSALCIALFAAFKYSEVIPVGADVTDFFIIPIGFSYYVFQAISYLVDIYSDKIKSEKNIANFMLYMCFFPKFLSGPIERPKKFLDKIKALKTLKILDYDRISSAFLYMLYGFLLKVAVADRLGMYTGAVLQSPENFGSLTLFAGMLAYTMQIYCDFFGYTTVARGVGRLFGLELSRNFDAPYLAANISDFWRRWHMSLSFWLRDYVYIPLGGNRKGFGVKCLNLMAVFILCGLWHGCGIHYILWGTLHGVFSIIYAIYKRKERKPKFPRIAEIHLTFLCVSFAWLFFGINNLKTSFTYISRMLTFTKGPGRFMQQIFSLGITGVDTVLFPLICLVIFMDILSLRSEKPSVDALLSINYIFRYALIYFMLIALLVFGIYGPGYNSADFMYMNY